MPITHAPYCENEFQLSGAEWDDKVLHPLYSPGLAPPDFYLFDHAKQLLSGHEFPDRRALLDTVQDILRGIEKGPLDRAFSFEWRDSSDVLQSMETRLTRQAFSVKRFY
jgi:hypothetical protein